jgi:putative aldouronate transport system substrate-binding protein
MQARNLALTRRGFIQLVALAAGASIAQACRPAPSVPSAATPTAAGAAQTRLQLPTHVPAQGVTADLPSTADGIDPGFFAYPSDPFKAVPSPPGKGGDVTIMTWNLQTPLRPLEENPHWQEINRQVGANLKVTAIGFADYSTKLATTMAGSDLPEVLYIPSGTSIQGFSQFLKTQCADLTPYLSGDAVKDYPNLANNSTAAWKATVYNGGIYGVPIPYSAYLWVLWVHQEQLDRAGVQMPTTADQLKQVMQAVTRPEEGLYAILEEASSAYGVNAGGGLYPQIFGAPNIWGVDASGTFTRSLETPAYKAAVGFARDLLAAGVYSPDSHTANSVVGKTAFMTRKVVMRYDGWIGAGSINAWNQAPTLNPPSVIRTIHPFAHDGGKPQYYLSSRSFGFTVLKKASPDRLKELLHILDLFASPFGSQEYLLLRYGVKDIHYTLDAKGNPVPTPQGTSDVNSLWSQAIGGYPQVLYNPLSEDYARFMQSEEQLMLPIGVSDPTIGLYSPTNSDTGAVLNMAFNDGITAIVAGRRPLSDFDQLVADWRSGGGDQIRAEYEQALAAAA